MLRASPSKRRRDYAPEQSADTDEVSEAWAERPKRLRVAEAEFVKADAAAFVVRGECLLKIHHDFNQWIRSSVWRTSPLPWEQYLQLTFKISPRMAQLLSSSSKAYRVLQKQILSSGQTVSILPESEGVMRALLSNVGNPVDPERLLSKWLTVVQNVQATSKVTAKVVHELLSDKKQPASPSAPSNSALSVFTSSQSSEWYTPEHVLSRVRLVFGGDIGTDPASSVEAQRRVHARVFYAAEADGLTQKWFPPVFLNTPSSNQSSRGGVSSHGQWVDTALSKYDDGEINEILILTYAAVHRVWFQKVVTRTNVDCVFLLALPFEHKDGRPSAPAPHPVAVLYLGPNRDRFQAHFAPLGVLMKSVPHQLS